MQRAAKPLDSTVCNRPHTEGRNAWFWLEPFANALWQHETRDYQVIRSALRGTSRFILVGYGLNAAISSIVTSHEPNLC